MGSPPMVAAAPHTPIFSAFLNYEGGSLSSLTMSHSAQK
ncbi:MAG: hypothetical protein MAG451_02851 [Anaerolineales bacterium]|nr:hypothetical protein [Anaerolineales bacterium]